MRSPARKCTKTTQVYEKLKEAIVSGQLPANERLQIETLKQRFAVGATPIREALSRLASYGLVVSEEQCGFKVASMSLAELMDLYRVRLLIESEALRLALRKGDTDWEAEVAGNWYRYKKFLEEATNRTASPETWDDIQKTFRFSLIKACASPWLLKLHAQLQDQATRYRFACLSAHFQNKRLLLAFIKENETLTNACLARDEEKAIALITKINKDSVQLIADTLEKRLQHETI